MFHGWAFVGSVESWDACIARDSLMIGMGQRESCDVFFMITRRILTTYTINKKGNILIRILVIGRLQ